MHCDSLGIHSGDTDSDATQLSGPNKHISLGNPLEYRLTRDAMLS